jgi:hypothetical protein
MRRGIMTEAQMRSPSASRRSLVYNSNDPYRSLADAIVCTAADDYRNALRSKDTALCSQLERFFQSDWFCLLSSVSADKLLTLLRREYKASVNPT